MTETAVWNIPILIGRDSRRTWIAAVTLAFGLFVTLSACASDGSYHTINGSVHVVAGKPAEDASSVNGSIKIDDDAAAESVSTVNGSIHLGARATAKSLTTVNGSITVNNDARTSYVKAVNGDLTIKERAEVSGALTNVNGKIRVDAGHIGGQIRTVDGDISVLGTAHVDGGILVEKPSGFSAHIGDPIVIIGPGAQVQGELKFERKVQLFVSDRATIGSVTGATAITFSGENPSSAR